MRVLSLCLLVFVTCYGQEPNTIDTIVTQYFSSTLCKSFYEQWAKFRKPIQNALETILRETYGEEGMNVYVRRWSNPYKLSDGFLVSDNIVQVLLKDLYLTQMPHLINPEVSFALASNVLVVEAKLRRMFIQADYQLFRNLSDVSYSSAKLNPFRESPFNLQQVRRDGEVTITAEDCTLSGFVVTSLHYQSVNFGHDTLQLRNCMFSIEISTPGLGSPPVIAPFLSKEQGRQLELLLVFPIREELLPKLQGAVFTYVNTSSLFQSSLPKIRQVQQDVFKHTWRFMAKATRNVNQMMMNEKRGIEKLDDVFIQWSDKDDLEGKIQDYKVALKDMTITGFDSAYSAHNGGPYKIPETKISDSVRFSSLQIRGHLFYSVGAAEKSYVFYGEISDISSFVSITVDSKAPKTLDRCELIGWRNFELHAPNIALISPHSLITGIVLNELPQLIIERLTRSFTNFVEGADINVGNKDDDTQTVDENPEEEEVGINKGNENDDGDGDNRDDEQNEMNVVIENEEDDKIHFNNDNGNESDGPIEQQEDDRTELSKAGKASENKIGNNKTKSMFNNKTFGHMFDENMFGKPMFGSQIFGDSGSINKGVYQDGGNDDSAEARMKRSGKDTDAGHYNSPQYFEDESQVYLNYHNCPHKTDMIGDPPEIEYRLFTRKNKNHYILLNENAEPVDTRIKVDLANAPLKVITHGWKSTADDFSVALIKDAYLNTRNLNIIAVDWSILADTVYCVAALYHVDIVGKSISRFLTAVSMRYGVAGDEMHLIGHSLGAHVVGVAAWKTPFAISRVTGLDPAGPLFYFKPPTDRIDASCADFVDIIHTCGGLLGFAYPIGHKDFYPNSGMFIQPGCVNSPHPVSCSHARSYQYYVDSIYISNKYPSLRCDTWKDFLLGKCDHYVSYMGDGAENLYNGKYYLEIFH